MAETKPKTDTPPEGPKKQTVAEGKKAFAEAMKAADKMRGGNPAKVQATGSALSIFASNHGAKAANELHKEYKLDGYGIMRVTGKN